MEQNRDEMPLDECWRRLGGESIGRLAYATGTGAHIVPVNHVVHDGSIYFRTRAGTKVVETWSHPHVAFEVDGRDQDEHWSVVAEGRLTLRGDEDAAWADAVRDLTPLHPATKHLIARIEVGVITGRRFLARQADSLIGA